MDFKLSTRGGKISAKNEVTIPKDVAEAIVDMLSNVECACVWSEYDKQYIKVHDIDDNIVDIVKNALAMTKLTDASSICG